jgi:pimeloyl-ACP methyl ester carboxylesterase
MRPARELKPAAKSASYVVAHHSARAEDGVQIAWTWWRRPSAELLVIAPGFWRVRLARENLYLANHFLRRGYDVIALDFRGHGESAGRYTFGESEPLDLKAVVEEVAGKAGPYERFSVLGLSMGGSIAAEALARWPDLPARALAMISSPADLRSLRPRPWKPDAMRQVRLRHALKMPRLAGRRLFRPKPSAALAVSKIQLPKLIVSSRGDWLVNPEQGRVLAEAAVEPVEYVHLDIPGSLHADALVKFVPLRLLRLLDRWFARNAPP